ncbi:MAG: hypothetical protein MK212_20760 [Saprospiraceae bacterium]|nr:hypothetical protein [Saprospiraceae bacterium]
MKNIVIIFGLLFSLSVGNIFAQNSSNSTERFTPQPKVSLSNGISEGTLTAAEVRALTGFTVDMGDFPRACTVRSYNLYYKPVGQDEAIPIVECTGNEFVDYARGALDKAQPGDEYTFTKIKVGAPGITSGIKASNNIKITVR